MAKNLAIGVVLLVAGLWLLIPVPGPEQWLAGAALPAFLTVLAGAVPALLVLLGVLLVWLDLEELRAKRKK